MIKLDIMSDPICPWCYIGKTHLEKALAEHPDHPFTVEWHPFQLNPDMPAEGMDRRVYLERKFGGKEAAIKVYSQIEQTAEALGLPIDFAAMKRTPNTIDAHRLIHWAGLEQKQNAVVDALFQAYFNLHVRRWGRHKGTSAYEVLRTQRVEDWLTLIGFPPSPQAWPRH